MAVLEPDGTVSFLTTDDREPEEPDDDRTATA
jgi:hypothetical protein